MDIKIPSGPPAGQPVEAVEDPSKTAEAAGETSETQETAPVSADAVSKIAEQVAAGELSGDEAVELLLAEVLDSKMVQDAPASVKAELAEALRALVETDPYLGSLTSVLGSLGQDR